VLVVFATPELPEYCSCKNVLLPHSDTELYVLNVKEQRKRTNESVKRQYVHQQMPKKNHMW
jgi:hypothetical protein